MNHRTRKQDEDRKLVWASLSTLAAGIVAVAAVTVAHAGDPAPAAAVEPGEALASLDPAALLAEAVEGRINAASPDEDSELHQGGPVITVIDLGDPAFGETLRRAAQSGVAIHALSCRVTLQTIRVIAPIPIRLGASSE